MNLGYDNNVASFPLAHGYTQFKVFCCEADMDDPFGEPIAMPTSVISDDEGDDENDVDEIAPPTRNPAWQPITDVPTRQVNEVQFDLNGPPTTAPGGEKHLNIVIQDYPNVVIDEEEKQPLSDMAELLLTHHKYGHISMKKLQEMAKQGILPRRLAKCRIPTCSACLYAKATKKPWSYQTGTCGVSRSVSITDARPHRADDGFPNNKTVQVCNRVR